MNIKSMNYEIVKCGGWKGSIVFAVCLSNDGVEYPLPQLIDILIDKLPTYRRLLLYGDIFKQPDGELFTFFNNIRNWGLVRGLYSVLVIEKFRNVRWDVLYREIHSILNLNLKMTYSDSISEVDLMNTDFIEIPVKSEGSLPKLANLFRRIIENNQFRPQIILNIDCKLLSNILDLIHSDGRILKELDIKIENS